MNKSIIKQILCLTVACGALYSFFFWLPATQCIIARAGISAAIKSTHLLRLVQDVATMIVCGIALNEIYKKNL